MENRSRNTDSSTRRWWRKKKYIGVLTLVPILVVVVYASVTQTFPSVTIPAAPTVTANCSTVILQTSSLVPVTGTLLFGCTNCNIICVAAPAISATSGLTATPTFTLPSGYTALALVPFSSGAVDCSMTATGAIALTTGTVITFGQSLFGWSYCAQYSVPNGGATLSTFTISWT